MQCPGHDELVGLLREARHILVFTGAGISTGSGIPDFRGPNGVWTKRSPVYFEEFMTSPFKRREYWEYKVEAWDAFSAARPNRTHVAIADLERIGRLGALVTQNIDGLHQAAGLADDRVIEIHGTNRLVECVACGARGEPEPAIAAFRKTGEVPTCAACAGWLKFATISFGQGLRPDVLERALHEAESADLVLALGSTLSVHPAASIPLVAVKRGAPYVVVNRGETDHDKLATLRLEGDVADIVPPAVAELSPPRARA